MFRATFTPLDDVDIYQDLPVGSGVKELEEHENDLYSLNLLKVKEAREAREREQAAKQAGKVIGEAVKLITADKQTQTPTGAAASSGDD